jgi:hypothetical protein
MGEIAEMMLDGTMCQGCGVWLHDGEDGPGYPGYCSSCEPDDEEEVRKREDTAKRVSAEVSQLAVAEIEKRMKAKFDPGVGQHFRKNVHGLIRGMYVSEHGVVTHDGMRATLQNNLLAQRRSQQRKAKKSNS